MYKEQRIISTPISNNRLNFSERKHPSLIVPSLITGTLDDVDIGDDTVIEGEV